MMEEEGDEHKELCVVTSNQLNATEPPISLLMPATEAGIMREVVDANQYGHGERSRSQVR